MKICPNCKQTYGDDSLNYCLNDGTILVSSGEAKTFEMNRSGSPTSNNQAARYTHNSQIVSDAFQNHSNAKGKSNSVFWVMLILGGLVLLCGGFAGMYALYVAQNVSNTNINANDLLANKKTSENSNRNAVITTAPANPARSNGLTMEKYLQIEMKSNYKKAVEILGSEGVQMSSSGSGTYKTEMYKWSSSVNEFIILLYLNDKLTTKSQAGLNKDINESISLEKYNQLKDGMSYEEVAAILGDGFEQSKTEMIGSVLVTYQWRGDNFKYITASFQNGKLTSRSQFGIK